MTDQNPTPAPMKNSHLLESGKQGLGGAIGLLIVILTAKFTEVAWEAWEAAAIVMVTNLVWGYIVPWLPKPPTSSTVKAPLLATLLALGMTMVALGACANGGGGITCDTPAKRLGCAESAVIGLDATADGLREQGIIEPGSNLEATIKAAFTSADRLLDSAHQVLEVEGESAQFIALLTELEAIVRELRLKLGRNEATNVRLFESARGWGTYRHPAGQHSRDPCGRAAHHRDTAAAHLGGAAGAAGLCESSGRGPRPQPG